MQTKRQRQERALKILIEKHAKIYFERQAYIERNGYYIAPSIKEINFNVEICNLKQKLEMK